VVNVSITQDITANTTAPLAKPHVADVMISLALDVLIKVIAIQTQIDTISLISPDFIPVKSMAEIIRTNSYIEIPTKIGFTNHFGINSPYFEEYINKVDQKNNRSFYKVNSY
jgi:hypothetical protein